MLRSTYRPVQNFPSDPLPPGWTEHKAPTGHAYYYNEQTKQSTYARPSSIEQTNAQSPANWIANSPLLANHRDHPTDNYFIPNSFHIQPASQNYRNDSFNPSSNHQPQRRHKHRDRPKTKQSIPQCEPWVLIRTRLGRQFIHNPSTKLSLWKVPEDIQHGVNKIQDEEKKKQSESVRLKKSKLGSDESDLEAKEDAIVDDAERPVETVPNRTETPCDEPVIAGSDDEYEEVEVTDSEGGHADERQPSPTLDEPMEFDEADIAQQLKAMGNDYGLDPGEYGDLHNDENTEDQGLPLSDDDAVALFCDMLEDYQCSPFTTWQTLIEDGRIIDDDRYTVLPNMRARRDAFAEWSKTKAQRVKNARLQESEKDPRLTYFAFLESHATPKLYWPEFRRKYQKDKAMRHNKISEKDREKWYRELIGRLKTPESTRKADLLILLKTVPLEQLNKSSSLQNLPTVLHTDTRFVAVRPAIRDALLEAHIASLPHPPRATDTVSGNANDLAQARDRDRREQALEARQNSVREQQQRQQKALRQSKGLLRDGQAEIEEAKRVGKDGILSHRQD